MIYGSGLAVNSLGRAKFRSAPDRRDRSGARPAPYGAHRAQVQTANARFKPFPPRSLGI